MNRKKSKEIGIGLIVIILLTLVYANHFDNGFYFDDQHTIVNNSSVKQINISSFFTDATTFSSLPTNQTYRPITTLENAFDYGIQNELNPIVFHIHIFSVFIFLGIAIYFLALTIFNVLEFSGHHKKLALLTSAMFCFLCANAETVNYIIQRAEITAALFVVLGLLFYAKHGFFKKTYLYLLFPFIGFFAKEMALTFPFLLLIYLIIIEEKIYLFELNTSSNRKKLLNAFKKSIPAFVVMFSFYFAIYKPLIPETFTPSNQSMFHYFITQPMVVFHYIVTYFFPYNLSIDTDWVTYNSLADYRVILGFLIHFIILLITIQLSKHQKFRLFSFGMLWFYVALIPTSTVIPLAEVLNDHRAFLPYIGLTIAVVTLLYNLHTYLKGKLSKQQVFLFTYGFLFLFFIGNSFGIIQRNTVWDTEYSLWKDCTEKSPNNGRGLMNFGVILMRKGNYDDAEKYFKKALKITPNYHYLHINLSIIENQKGNTTKAKEYLTKALELKPDHVTLYYYARFLKQNNQLEEAEEKLLESIRLSKNYTNSYELLLKVYEESNQKEKLLNLAKTLLEIHPTNATALSYINPQKAIQNKINRLKEKLNRTPNADDYLSLSLLYFNNQQYIKAKEASLQALEIEPNYVEAYNNLGIANFKLNDYNGAVDAYQKALKINPKYQLVKNNLANAINAKATIRDFHINESLKFYNEGKFQQCIEAAERSIAIEPTSNAFNNICAAYNQLGEFKKAINACNKSLSLDEKNVNAKGNKKYAITQLQQQ